MRARSLIRRWMPALVAVGLLVAGPSATAEEPKNPPVDGPFGRPPSPRRHTSAERTSSVNRFQDEMRARAERNRAAMDRTAADRAAQDRANRERTEQARAAQERSAQQRAANERAARDQAARQRAAQDQAARQRAAQERPAPANRFQEEMRARAERNSAAMDRAAADRAAQDRANRERAEQGRAAADRAAQDRAARDRATQAQAARDRAAQEQRVARNASPGGRDAFGREVRERAAESAAALERQNRERAERDRAAQDRAARERAARDDAARDRERDRDRTPRDRDAGRPNDRGDAAGPRAPSPSTDLRTDDSRRDRSRFGGDRRDGDRNGFWRDAARARRENSWDGGRERHAFRRDSYYDRNRFSLSFRFSSGCYDGWRYYSPFRHHRSGCDYAFFYPSCVTYAYVPFGFFCDVEPVYVTRYVYVHEPVDEYVVDEGPYAPAGDAGTVEPVPFTDSPVVERYLREGSEAFAKADYFEAARKFRLAALAQPDKAAPLFALGQALLALGDDAYAAAVVRRALALEPALVDETGDIVGVFQSREEFERVLGELEKRAAESTERSDARFLLAMERYFSGDPKSQDDFRGIAGALPDDPAVKLLRAAADKRFAAAAEALPPIEGAVPPK